MKQNTWVHSYYEKKVHQKESVTLSESILLSRGKNYYKFDGNLSKCVICLDA